MASYLKHVGYDNRFSHQRLDAALQRVGQCFVLACYSRYKTCWDYVRELMHAVSSLCQACCPALLSSPLFRLSSLLRLLRGMGARWFKPHQYFSTSAAAVILVVLGSWYNLFACLLYNLWSSLASMVKRAESHCRPHDTPWSHPTRHVFYSPCCCTCQVHRRGCLGGGGEPAWSSGQALPRQ